jgi:hypothetical protein
MRSHKPLFAETRPPHPNKSVIPTAIDALVRVAVAIFFEVVVVSVGAAVEQSFNTFDISTKPLAP